MNIRNLAFATVTVVTSWLALPACRLEEPLDLPAAPTGEAQDGEEALFCGGIATFECPDGYVCVDDPSDDCMPNKGGSDCDGMCVVDQSPREPTPSEPQLLMSNRRSVLSP